MHDKLSEDCIRRIRYKISVMQFAVQKLED